MKRLKKILALALAMAMVLGMTSMAAFAAPTANQPHTITITNTDQNVSHNYDAYQIFKGNLDDKELTLSDIQWGSGINGDALITALKNTTDKNLLATSAIHVADAVVEDGETVEAAKDIAVGESLFKYCETAADVAKILGTFTPTGQRYDETTGVATSNTGVTDSAVASKIDAVATIIGDTSGVLTSTKVAFVEGTDDDGKGTGTYTAAVTGDGYYFIKDTTANAALNNEEEGTSDTRSKYLLSVVKDTTIVAKDTGLNPDKKIRKDAETKVAADSAAIGDTVNFEVTVTVPNTKKYEDHFWFVMNDKLPEGITFTGITSVEIGSKTLNETTKAGDSAEDLLTAEDENGNETYNGNTGYYTLKYATGDTDVAAPAITDGKYPWEATGFDAVKEAGGQKIELTFRQFKKFVETNDLIDQTVTVKYTGVVNDDAKFDGTKNENEVTFNYSNEPNHDYDGDNPGPEDDDVTGETPKSKTRTYTTSLKIKKVDENGDPLEGATFELKGTKLNRTVLTGYKFVEETYSPKNGETIEAEASYWKLKDGSYTTTDPDTVQNKTQYAEPTTKKYFKVTYNKAEVAAKEVDTILVTDRNGIAEFIGLNAGDDYTLEEIAAPDGYNKIDGQSAITITWEDPDAIDTTELTGDDLTAANAKKAQGGFTLSATQFAEETTWNATDKQFEVTIKNQSGTELPSTGGIGTTIFYVVGAILVIGAGVVLVTRRRMDA